MPQPLSLLPPSIPDPIFAIAAEAKKAGPEGIDATIGVYMNEEGKTFLLPSVKKAMTETARALTERSYSYPPLLGLPTYRDAVGKLIFGAKPPLHAAIATTGGTGAVALNLRLLQRMDEDITVIVPMPAWANHPPLCHAANVRIVDVPYLAHGKPDIDGIADGLKRTKGPAAVLLQTGCHNPTGLDFSPDQWNELASVLRERDAAALLDLAYQGFKGTPEEDAAPVRACIDAGVTTLVAWSASKNHAIYSERTGLACAVVPDEKTKRNVEGHYSSITRGIHSATATFGQSVVATVQERFQKEWLEDIANVRRTLAEKRAALVRALPERFRAAVEGNGMFAQLPLTPEEIDRLRTEEHVFMTGDGRINIAGIPLRRMEELSERIGRVTT